jgi:serine/threonine protein phosphatase 1
VKSDLSRGLKCVTLIRHLGDPVALLIGFRMRAFLQQWRQCLSLDPDPGFSTSAPLQARIPAGQRVYAIGDIHGRRDLLEKILATIVEDSAPLKEEQVTLVFLGDYVDRGPDSRGVLECLLSALPTGWQTLFLKGNHEAIMLRFMHDLTAGPNWLAIGGQATLSSYGIHSDETRHPAIRLLAAQEALWQRLPAAHYQLLSGLRLVATIGDYGFVHAGIRPGIPLDAQDEEDLLWIRNEFLRSTADHGLVIVHGHTIVGAPELYTNRISIDTGAFATGCLTTLVLEEDRRWFLRT